MKKPVLGVNWIIIFFFITLSGCAGTNIQGSKEAAPHIIEAPSAKNKILLHVKPEMLPEGAQAVLPSFDGEPFFVTLPARQQDSVSTNLVHKEVVLPILNALGFERRRNAHSLPPEHGVKMPVANFKGLVQDLTLQYKKNKKLFRPKTQKILDVSLGKMEASLEINQALEKGEGMNFKQLVADIERQEIQYPFLQVVDNVPIEHTLILATRWEGQTVHSVRGTVIDKYIITNKKELSPRTAVKSVIKSLAKVKGVNKVVSKTVENGPHLILLPYGSDSAGKTILRFSYRMLLHTVFNNEDGPFIVWMDAETGDILKLVPLYDNVRAEGLGYLRDPGTGETFKAPFDVDPASGGQYTLQKQGVSNRIDYGADGDPSNDLSIPENTNGSSSVFANFDQLPINDVAESICASGSNKGFEQVNLLASISFYVKHMINLGIFRPFPRLEGVSTDDPDPFNPRIELSGYCNAHASMRFGVCSGYYDPSCPNAPYTGLNWIHDKSMIAHEMGHNITARLANGRPSDWCGASTCPIPNDWLIPTHDFADAWGAYFEHTNCSGGWVNKNHGGVDNSLNCANHDERGGLPRLHEVSTPFDPSNPGDHFPEKSIGSILVGGNYANGQTGSAALWQVRLGMISKSPFGAIYYGRRLTQALKNTGFIGQSDSAYHPGLYQKFLNLEMEMVDQWASSGSYTGPTIYGQRGSHTTNKVTAGFARTGLFLIPLECIDGDPSTGKVGYCPKWKGGENGGDAVIDIKDNDPSDDYSFAGVAHPEEDYLGMIGPAPTFQVWTGPRYRLDVVNKVATFNNPAPCNTRFRVEVSTSQNFTSVATIKSPWINVDTDPTTPSSPECYGTWTPSAPEWNVLQSNSPLTLLYYRAITNHSATKNRRVSTRPGKLWRVPPPYAVLTLDGKAEY